MIISLVALIATGNIISFQVAADIVAVNTYISIITKLGAKLGANHYFIRQSVSSQWSLWPFNQQLVCLCAAMVLQCRVAMVVTLR